MSRVAIIDTTVFLNILDVPSRNQDREAVLTRFKELIKEGREFLLPMATIVEAGNHIGKCGDGQTRRKYGKVFVEQVEKAFDGKAPWKISEFPKTEEIKKWISTFPDRVCCSKSEEKPNEGLSFGDLSIIEEFNNVHQISPNSKVFIWSLDTDLSSYSYD